MIGRSYWWNIIKRDYAAATHSRSDSHVAAGILARSQRVIEGKFADKRPFKTASKISWSGSSMLLFRFSHIHINDYPSNCKSKSTTYNDAAALPSEMPQIPDVEAPHKQQSPQN